MVENHSCRQERIAVMTSSPRDDSTMLTLDKSASPYNRFNRYKTESTERCDRQMERWSGRGGNGRQTERRQWLHQEPSDDAPRRKVRNNDSAERFSSTTAVTGRRRKILNSFSV